MNLFEQFFSWLYYYSKPLYILVVTTIVFLILAFLTVLLKAG